MASKPDTELSAQGRQSLVATEKGSQIPNDATSPHETMEKPSKLKALVINLPEPSVANSKLEDTADS